MSSPSGEQYRDLSLWWDGLPAPLTQRPALPGDLDVDVAIVGGGLTGLWTAYYLQEADPSIRIAIIERNTVGFGASGRNGGWCSALFPASEGKIDKVGGPGAGRAIRLAMEATVVEVGRAAAAEGIECGFAHGGTIGLARTPAQWARTQAGVEESRKLGVPEDSLRLLTAAEATEMVGATDILGADFSPHCAALDPARLLHGLAQVIEARGVAIYEGTTAFSIRPGWVTTDHGTVRAETIVQATEGYTRTLAGQARRIVPVYSLMIATEPLSDAFWSEVRLDERPTFADHRHLVIYGQRTEDGRLAFGGRGAPYHFNSTIRPEFDRNATVHEALHRTLLELFPQFGDAAITHRWGGPLGISRDWFPSVGLDRSTGLAWAGGYVGDGLATTNLSGRTLRDLILHQSTELTSLAWVDHRSKAWEPEPLRYLGINAGLYLAGVADTAEAKAGRETWHAKVLSALTGH